MRLRYLVVLFIHSFIFNLIMQSPVPLSDMSWCLNETDEFIAFKRIKRVITNKRKLVYSKVGQTYFLLENKKQTNKKQNRQLSCFSPYFEKKKMKEKHLIIVFWTYQNWKRNGRVPPKVSLTKAIVIWERL